MSHKQLVWYLRRALNMLKVLPESRGKILVRELLQEQIENENSRLTTRTTR